jgi:hypothetical protein
MNRNDTETNASIEANLTQVGSRSDLITQLRGIVRREQRPERKEATFLLVEMLENGRPAEGHRAAGPRAGCAAWRTGVTAQAYPLQWPEGWPRTPYGRRGPSRFGKNLGFREIEKLQNELRLLGGRNVVISSNVPLRQDGLPYASQAGKRYDDPRVAVYFSLKSKASAWPGTATTPPGRISGR